MGILTRIFQALSLFNDKSEKKYTPLFSHLNYRFHHHEFELLETALTHPSLAEDNVPSHMSSYERLEYLGDAVLELIVSEYLFRLYPKASEGELTSRRAELVNQSALALVGKRMNLQNYIRSQEVKEHPIEQSESVLSDVVESLIGAVYVAGGLQAARKSIHALLPFNTREFNTKDRSSFNYKGKLIEYCHSHDLPEPQFRTVARGGPDHARIYTVAIYLLEQEYGRGDGSSKKKAGQHAAKHALETLAKLAESGNNVPDADEEG